MHTDCNGFLTNQLLEKLFDINQFLLFFFTMKEKKICFYVLSKKAQPSYTSGTLNMYKKQIFLRMIDSLGKLIPPLPSYYSCPWFGQEIQCKYYLLSSTSKKIISVSCILSTQSHCIAWICKTASCIFVRRHGLLLRNLRIPQYQSMIYWQICQSSHHPINWTSETIHVNAFRRGIFLSGQGHLEDEGHWFY